MSESSFSPIMFDKLQWAQAPIDPTWIKDGCPTARVAHLVETEDTLAHVVVWDCTAGAFDWHFDLEETVQIIEGEVRILDKSGTITTLRAGEMCFFQAGSVSTWHVDRYVRKIAFCRHATLKPVGLAIRAANKFSRMISRAL